MRNLAASLFIVLSFNACSPPSQDQTPKVAEDQRRSLEKAKALEYDLDRSTEEQAQQTRTQVE